MTKFLLGIAVGYVFSNVIDELVGKVTTDITKPSVPPTPSEDVPIT